MGKLTYDEYYALKRAGQLPDHYDLFDSLPLEVRELYGCSNYMDFLDELEKKYSLSILTGGSISNAIYLVMLGIISIGELPTFIERGDYDSADIVSPEVGVDRRVALQCAIKICRHLLKQCSEYMDIGNIDAYIEDFKDELSG